MCQCMSGYQCPQCMPYETKPVPHKHADLIKAWADGAKIQHYSGGVWWDWVSSSSPPWRIELTYRIKPEVKPDSVFYTRLTQGGECEFGKKQLVTDNIKAIFDSETGKLKSVELI